MKRVYFKFIDAKLMADGAIGTNDLIDSFGIGRQQASKLFREYKEINPDNMAYTPKGAGSKYNKLETFKPVSLEGDAGEFLECLEVVFK